MDIISKYKLEFEKIYNDRSSSTLTIEAQNEIEEYLIQNNYLSSKTSCGNCLMNAMFRCYSNYLKNNNSTDDERRVPKSKSRKKRD